MFDVVHLLATIDSLKQELAARDTNGLNLNERSRELLGFLISMAALHDADMAKQFAEELEQELSRAQSNCDNKNVQIEDIKRQLAAKDVLLRQAYEVLETIDKVAKESKNIISVAGQVMRILGKVRALMVAINKELK